MRGEKQRKYHESEPECGPAPAAGPAASGWGMGQIGALGFAFATVMSQGVVKDADNGEGLNGWSPAQWWTRTPRVVNQFSGD